MSGGDSPMDDGETTGLNFGVLLQENAKGFIR